MLKLFVATHEGLKIKEDVNLVYAPAINGDVTILSNHAWYVTALKSGKFFYKNATSTQQYQISDGIMEVKDNNVIVLVKDITIIQ